MKENFFKNFCHAINFIILFVIVKIKIQNKKKFFFFYKILNFLIIIHIFLSLPKFN